MPDLTTENDELATLRARIAELESQSVQKSAGAAISETDDALQQYDKQQAVQARIQEIQNVAGPQFKAVMTGLGFKDADIQDVLQEFGGLATVVQIDERSHVPVMQVGGRMLTLDQALPLHPLIQRRVNGRDAADPIGAARRKIEENKKEIQAIVSGSKQSFGVECSQASITRIGRLKTEVRTLEKQIADATPQAATPQAAAPVQQKQYVDPEKQFQLDDLDRQINLQKSKLLSNGTSTVRTDVLAEIGSLKKRRKTIVDSMNVK